MTSGGKTLLPRDSTRARISSGLIAPLGDGVKLNISVTC
jgi:hypothetical protein